MICYTCDQTPVTGNLRYNVADAVGICNNCGIGVCVRHSHKDAMPGSPLLCLSCSGLPTMVTTNRVVASNQRKEKAGSN